MAEKRTEPNASPKEAVPVSGSSRRYDGLLRYLGARLYQERDRARRDKAPEGEQKR